MESIGFVIGQLSMIKKMLEVRCWCYSQEIEMLVNCSANCQPKSEHKDGKIERRSMKSGVRDNRPFHQIIEKCAGKRTFREKVNIGKTQYSCAVPTHQKVRSRKTLISWAFLCSELS